MSTVMNTTITSIQEMRDLWALLFPGVQAPDDPQWAFWFLRHDRNVVRQGITELASKYRKLGGVMDATYMAKFASSVMNRLSIAQSNTAPLAHRNTGNTQEIYR